MPATHAAPPSPAAHTVLVELPLAEIADDPANERTAADLSAAALNELVASIAAQGVLEPIQVVRAGPHYRIISGHRRRAAALLAGLPSIPALVHFTSHSTDEAQIARQRITANLHRADMNPVLLARSLRDLVDQGGYTQAEVSADFGKSQAWLANLVRLLDLPAEIQDQIGVSLSAAHGVALLGITLPEWNYNYTECATVEAVRRRLAQQAISEDWSSKELARRVTNYMQSQEAWRTYKRQADERKERQAQEGAEREAAGDRQSLGERRRALATQLSNEWAAEQTAHRAKRRAIIAGVIKTQIPDPDTSPSHRFRLLRAAAQLAYDRPHLYGNLDIKRAVFLKELEQASTVEHLSQSLTRYIRALALAAVDYDVIAVDGDVGKILDHWYSLNIYIQEAVRAAGLERTRTPDFAALAREQLPDPPGETPIAWYCAPGDHRYHAPATGAEQCPQCGANMEQYPAAEWAKLQEDEEEEDEAEGDED